MDEIEKRVLRWRKPTLCEKMKVSDELLIDLKESELITADMIKLIDVSIFWQHCNILLPVLTANSANITFQMCCTCCLELLGIVP